MRAPKERGQLPATWEQVRLADIAEVRLGRQRSPARATGPHMRPYMRAANVTWAGIDLADVKEMDFSPREACVYELRDGDILLAEASGSASEVGKPAIWRNQVPGACFQNTLIRVRAPVQFAPFLHRHFLNDAVSGAFAAAARGVGIHHLGAQALVDWQVRLPPLGEQHRIVEALDSYLTRLDAATEGLKRVSANLKRYRASVLKAAVEGRLVPTEADLAKKEGRPYEPASALLARILKERRRRWEEAELARMRAKRALPKENQWKAKYAEVAASDADTLPPLPEGWCWTSWNQIGFSQNGKAFPSSSYQQEGVRLLRPGNLHESGRVEWTPHNTRCLPERFVEEARSYLVGEGELVMNLTAQSLKDEFLGRTCITGANEHCLLNQRIARLTPVIVDSRYVLWVFRSPWFRQFVDGLNQGSLIQHMFTSQLGEFAFPLAPLEEQRRIVLGIERALSVQDHLRGTATDTVNRIARLRQSILKWGFEGKLVDQDPADEPSSALLARIKAERPSEDAPAPPRTGSRRRAKGKAA